jgi:hypothetical protein
MTIRNFIDVDLLAFAGIVLTQVERPAPTDSDCVFLLEPTAKAHKLHLAVTVDYYPEGF